MNLLERVLTLLRANLNTMVEQADDPEKALKQLQIDMRNQLVQVKTQVATAIAESHKLRKRSQEKATEATLWLKKAEQAVQQGNDEAARTALIHYNEINRQVYRYQQQQKEQERLIATMRSVLHQLEAKIAEVETTIDLLVTRKRNALIQQRVFEALNQSSRMGKQNPTNKAQDAVTEAEARAQALAELHQQDLDTQLNQLSTEQTIEQQLKSLKAKKERAHTPPLLPGGHPSTAPLLKPQPQQGTPLRKQKQHIETDRRQEDPAPLTELDLEHLKKLIESSQE